MHTIHFHPWFRIELLKARQRFTIGTLSRSLQFILVQQLQLQKQSSGFNNNNNNNNLLYYNR